MKTLTLIGIVLLFVSATQAQVSVNVNIGTPPPWGPAGYTEVRYYYLPDVQAYYDIHSNMFIYMGGGGVWIQRTYLPTRYRSYDLYSGYKVVMTDYHGETPYNNFNEYKTRYVRGYQGPAQRTIGERPARGKSSAKIPHGGNNGKSGNVQGKGAENGNGVIKVDSHGKGNSKGKK